MQTAPLTTRKLTEHRARPSAFFEFSGGETVDELEALRSLGLERARALRLVFRRRGSAVRPRQMEQHELQDRDGEWWETLDHLHVAERGTEHLVAVPEHLIH